MKVKTSKLNSFQLQPEWAFVFIAAIFGIVLVFVNPPFQTNDEDRHFFHAYHIASGDILPTQNGTQIGGNVPLNLTYVVNYFQGLPFQTKDDAQLENLRATMSQRKKEAGKITLNERNSEYRHDHSYSTNPIPYLPYSIGIIFGKIINSKPLWLGWFARLFGLICYIIIIFYAIKYTPVFKYVLLLYALTPMILYQSASVTYDMLSNGISFLYLAFCLYYAFVPDAKITIRSLAFITVLAILHYYSKSGYPLILFVFFLIPPGKFGNMKRALTIYASMALIFVLIFFYLDSFTWGALVAAQHYDLGNVPQLRKEYDFGGTSEKISYIFSHPFEYITLLTNNFLFFRQEWVSGTIGRFGYSYLLMPKIIIILHGIVLITVALLDSSANIKLNLYQKLLAFFIAIGTVYLIMGGLLLYSPKGAEMVFGLQGRYFAPAVPILLLVFYNNAFPQSILKRFSGLIAPAYSALVLLYTVIFINNFFYK
ncbi:MAG: hypothetical protein HW421_1325 [Ignavibacteria bacterium]|nr:hypothetical protein [Ignavibacteria bacterium]